MAIDAESLKKANDNLNAELSRIAASIRGITAAAPGMNAQLNDLKTKFANVKMMEEFGDELAAIQVQFGKNSKIAKNMESKFQKLSDIMADTEGIEAQINGLTRLNDLQKKQAAEEIKLAQTQGKLLQAHLKENWNKFKDSFKTAEGKVGIQSALQGGAGAVAGGIGIAKDPKAALMTAMGPWGVILDMIVSVVDGIRKTRSEMHAASAAAGNFADGLANANAESIALNKNQAEFATKGLNIAEVTKVYTALKNTGIEALGRVGSGLSNLAMDTIAFSKASGESYDAVAGRFANLIRNFGETQEGISGTYNKVLNAATAVAKKGIMATADFMKTVDSLSDSFKDAGGNISDVSGVLSGVSNIMSNMGRPLANIQKVASGILGITKASEGMQVFMAKMSGVQGGYAESLFAAQQRGGGFDLTKKGEFDANKMIDMARNAIMKPTEGIGDAGTRRLMVEKMGSQFGMDAETVQVFKELSSGAISQEEAATSIEKLRDAAIKNNLDSKGMFDILRDILMGLIAKPIVMIYEFLQGIKLPGFGGGGNTQETTSLRENLEKASQAGKATGATIKSGGLLRVHANEMLYPVAKTEPFKDNSGGNNGGNLNMSFNMNISEESLRTSFREMEQKTLTYLHQQQKMNYVG